ncbi:MAG: DUF3108 domain-containing protein [Chlorobiales bacterium]|jgi:hypothetical protein|nr:DUF3108 domain-containing protein [Chlorobiales bacterium]
MNIYRTVLTGFLLLALSTSGLGQIPATSSAAERVSKTASPVSGSRLLDSVLSQSPITDFNYRTISNNAYKPGERLTYSIKYGLITAVNTEIIVAGDTTIRSRDCYRIQYKARTVPVFDAFFKVDDKYESFIDKSGQFPMKFTRRIREGSYKADGDLEFFHDRGLVIAPKQNKLYPIEPFTHDVLSAYFFVRTLDLRKHKKGDIITLKNFVKDKTHTLDVKFHGRDLIETDLGVFRTVMLEPLATDAGLFKSEGKIMIWLTDDENKIPVRIAIKVAVGSLKAEITSIQNNRHALTSKFE